MIPSDCLLIIRFGCRVPEGASIHDKNYYTSNKDHLYQAFSDISLHVQAHTQAELAHAASMYTWTPSLGAYNMIRLGYTNTILF